MIVRIWRGVAPEGSRADAYIEHLERAVLPLLMDVAGFSGMQLLARVAKEGIEFLVTTRWESMEAVRAFAGEEAERAVVAPEARSLLSDFDEFVRHYIVVEQFGTLPSSRSSTCGLGRAHQGRFPNREGSAPFPTRPLDPK